jgi:hypothetical protein
MLLTLVAPLLRVKDSDGARESNARAIWSMAASGMLEGRGLFGTGEQTGVVSGSP